MSRLTDGFSTTIAFPLFPAVKFWEVDVQPPGFDGGGENDITNMRNVAWRTKAPKKLLTLTDSTINAHYDPAVLNDVRTMMQVNQHIHIHHPDGSKWAFWGWLDKFVPGANKEGSPPTAQLTISPSNYDANGNEVAPLYELSTSTHT